MKVRVVRMRNRGVPIARAQLVHERDMVGQLLVGEHNDEGLGRTLRVATLKGTLPMRSSELPPLLDVALLWAGANGFVLAGFERHGEADYVQSWWCREL